MLESADTRFAVTAQPSNQMALTSLNPVFWPHRFGFRVPASAVPGGTVTVIVNDGRWLVQCPYCNSAQYAAPNDRRFYCPECDNGHTGQWCRAAWPSAADAADIDALLSARPQMNQNWRPDQGETVQQLIADNDAHGVTVDPALRQRHP